MLWTFARFGYQDETLMDMMHDIAVKLQANCDSKTLAEVIYAMAQLGWADIRLHNLVADYAMDNVQVQGVLNGVSCGPVYNTMHSMCRGLVICGSCRLHNGVYWHSSHCGSGCRCSLVLSNAFCR